jgi:hypothetical protein
MTTLLLEKLKNKVESWKSEGYPGITSETRKILNHIYKVNYLYRPQKEAFETYIYLKEILGNKTTSDIIPSLYESGRELIESLSISSEEKVDLAYDPKRDEKIKELIEEQYGQFAYPNQVYSLTMGAGKTLLMGTLVMYEFILSSQYPEDPRFAKNILVFAPDTTIIESLKEIKSFDYRIVVPKEYENVVLNIKYHYLETPDTPVNLVGNYNIIVSNSQKIILKKKNNVLKSGQILLNEADRNKQFHKNLRREAIRRLSNLAIFVDEAHHSYGSNLDKTLKRTRQTIKYLNEEGKTPLVNVVNLTGTPYVNNNLISDVVYHFGLKQGIEEGILKQVKFKDYDNVKSEEFVSDVVEEFLDRYSDIMLEGKLPKIAFYSSNIEDLQQNLRPALEKVLTSKGISIDTVLEYHTKKEENKEEFLKLDTEESKKQFVLLVGKGTEGWNVRSLVATALYRKPTSSIFVLQASTRCMRSIGDNSTFATIFLSNENATILEKELQKNFAVTRADLERQDTEKIDLELNILKKKKIKVKKVLKEIISIKKKEPRDITLKSIEDYAYSIKEGVITEGGILLDKDNKTAYIQTKSKKEKKWVKTSVSPYHFISNLSVRTHLPCLSIKEIIETNDLKVDDMESLNTNNYYDVLNLISQDITNQIFDYKENKSVIEEELELTKNFPFKLSRDKGKSKLVVYKAEGDDSRLGFHINPYSFDTDDEKDLFFFLSETLEPNEVITDVYFTGNITDSSHTDFYFEYWNPTKERISRYFPDFLIETSKGRFIVIEVKGDQERTTYQQNKEMFEKGEKKIFDEVYAKELGFKDFQKENGNFDYHIIFNAKLQQRQKELLGKINSNIQR